jgi:hypothetical protein
MDARIRCPRCGEYGATVAAFVGPTTVTSAIWCPRCAVVHCGTGSSELVRLIPFRHGFRRRNVHTE